MAKKAKKKPQVKHVSAISQRRITALEKQGRVCCIKALFVDVQGRIAFYVSGEDPLKINLPGGTREDDELAWCTLYREISEELRQYPEQIELYKDARVIAEGEVPTAKSRAKKGVKHVWICKIVVSDVTVLLPSLGCGELAALLTCVNRMHALEMLAMHSQTRLENTALYKVALHNV